MSKINDFAVYCTSEHTAPFSKHNGLAQLNIVKDFYKDNGLEIPASVTVTTSKNAGRLTKDEQIAIYAAALKGENEALANVAKIGNSDEKVTFTKTYTYSELLADFAPAVVASKLIDNLSVSDNEKFSAIRKHTAPADIAISEIPAFIKALQSIYDEATKPEKK